ncbi:YciI family protein [Hyphococcus sp.]|uniref:YciI family protein n=1 Tax=Hyphococcus sp. TaxID=2038636 RepID=UPI00208A8CAF|nr:MAG: hypothetical protein DHS20C04_23410 [Marinicaulis sp.]
MPQFILICRDKPDSLALRIETRQAHLEYFHKFGNKLQLGGPMLDEAGNPVGSMLIIEAADATAAQSIADADPYQRAGLFAEVSVIPFKTVIANFPKS